MYGMSCRKFEPRYNLAHAVIMHAVAAAAFGCASVIPFSFFFFSSSLSFINPDPILEFFALFPVTFENSDMPINMSQFCLPVIMHECECGVQQDNPSDQPGDQEQ